VTSYRKHRTQEISYCLLLYSAAQHAELVK